MMKFCSNPNCTQSNPQNTSDFHKDSRKPDGLRSRCKTCELAKAAEYRAQNRELLRKNQADYYERNGEIQKQASRTWKANNKEQTQAEWQEWYEKNKEHRSEYLREYAVANPNVILEKQRKRRARKIAAAGSFSEAEFQEKLIQSGHRCFYCGTDLVKGNTTRDHYIPLILGGSDSIDNIVPACRSCNSRKRTKLPQDFKPKTGNTEPSREGQ